MSQNRAQQLLPERIECGELLLRRWTSRDAGALSSAVAQNADLLRPWMAFMEFEPMSLAQRREMLAQREREYLSGGDVMLGIFLGGEVAGSCGLHRRGPPDTLEIGYWIVRSLTKRGLASRVAWLLTGAAFSVPGIDYVEIHHDRANTASSSVPRRLGFDLVSTQSRAPQAPAEVGVDCAWRVSRAAWPPANMCSGPHS